MNLKPGVKAVTHGLVFDTNHNYKLVELIEFIPASMFWTSQDGHTWCDPNSDRWAVMSLGSIFQKSARTHESMYSLIRPRNLRPINGGESPEESTEAMRKLHELPQEVTT